VPARVSRSTFADTAAIRRGGVVFRYIRGVVLVRAIVILLASAIALGCDRAPPPAPASSTAPSGPQHERVAAAVVTMLAPGRQTHVARAGDGTLWWVQESDDGRDVAFALGADAVPRATGLTSARVLAAADVAANGSAGGASGTFHSIATDHAGRIWFYFAGGAGRRAVVCLGVFDPRDESIRVVMDEARLRKATGMGASLVLAHGTLAGPAGGESLWLWVRHSDGSALFRVDAKSGDVSPPIDVVNTTAGAPLEMTGPGQAVGAAADGGLLLRDAHDVELWRIDPSGHATLPHPLIGLPTALSAPAGDARGRAYLVAGDAPLIPARSDAEALIPVPPIRYPALLIVEAGKLRGIGRQDLTLPAEVSAEEMRVQELIAETEETLVGYDEQSGALLRFRIVQW
jgi:hypothetical protein